MSIIDALNTSFFYFPEHTIYLYTRDCKLYMLNFHNGTILYKNNDASNDCGIITRENIDKWDIVYIHRKTITLFGSYLNVPNINYY
jgi:hypothetical protein